MKKVISDDRSEINDMKSEYDFSNMKGAVRGKYHKAYRAGHKVVIHMADGTVATQYLRLRKAQSCWNRTSENILLTRNQSTRRSGH